MRIERIDNEAICKIKQQEEHLEKHEQQLSDFIKMHKINIKKEMYNTHCEIIESMNHSKLTRSMVQKLERSHSKFQNVISEYFSDQKLTDLMFKPDESDDENIMSFLKSNKTTYQSSK